MKEFEKADISGQNELTTSLNSHKLESGKDIFMAEPGQGELSSSDQKEQEADKRTNKRIISPQTRRLLDSLNIPGENASVDEKRTYDMAVKAIMEKSGVPLMAGGETPPARDNPEQENKPSGQNSGSSERGIATGTGHKFEELPQSEQDKIRRAFTEQFGEGMPDEMVKKFYELAGAGASRERRVIGVPNNLEDLAELIMKTSDPTIWGREGEKPLINENGSVNTKNFLDWFRNNMFRVHNFNPTSPVNFFNDLGMSVRNDQWGSTISFYEIVFQESLFLDKKNVDGKEQTVVNPDYQALRSQLLQEAFLFMLMRNGDLDYVLNRPLADQMLGKLAENFVANPLTRSNFMEFIFTLPSMQKSSFKELSAEAGKEIRTKQETNFYMGDAIRTALTAYINIFDYESLKKVLGPDSPLFKLKYEKWDTESGTRKIEDGKKAFSEISQDIKLEQKEKDPEKRKAKERKNAWFYTEEDARKYNVKAGDIKLYEIDGKGKAGKVDPKNGSPHPDYINYLNIFLSAMPDQNQQKEVRERMVLSIMKKTGISYREAQLAEAWAYSMTHMTGIAAVNDTQAVGFDVWTKLTRFREYRKRQKAESRNASYGSKYNLEGLKRLALPFIEGARDTKGRTIREVIQGGQTTINLDKTFKNREDYKKDANGYIILHQNGRDVTSHFKARNYDIRMVAGKDSNEKEKQLVFLDDNGNIVDIGNARPEEGTIEADHVEFNENVMRQFTPNHLREAHGVYEFIMKQVEMDFPSMVEGYDARGNPILNHEKVEEVKTKIEHFVRYSLSTWPEIDYGAKFKMFESKEYRNEKGRLEDSEGHELDEEWYILDRFGRRTDERSNPRSVPVIKEQTILESMFGADALRFVQYEIEKRGLANAKGDQSKLVKIKEVGFGDKEQDFDLDISSTKNEHFRIAVWKGVFDYMIAAEIASHRDRGSGRRYYNYDDIKKAADALRDGEFVTPDQIKKIRELTRSRARWTYGEELGYIFAQAGFESFWNILKVMFKDAMKDI